MTFTSRGTNILRRRSLCKLGASFYRWIGDAGLGYPRLRLASWRLCLLSGYWTELYPTNRTRVAQALFALRAPALTRPEIPTRWGKGLFRVSRFSLTISLQPHIEASSSQSITTQVSSSHDCTQITSFVSSSFLFRLVAHAIPILAAAQ